MKSSAVWVAVAVALLSAAIVAIFLFPFGQHRIDLYITDQCHPFLARTDEVVETLVLRENYLVTFLNRSDHPVEIVMPPGWFNVDRTIVPPARYVILQVERNRAGEDIYSIGGECGTDRPHLKLVETT